MFFPKLSPRNLFTIVTVVLALAVVSSPMVTSAQRSGGDPSAERERVRGQKAQVATQVDALQATDAQVEAALDALENNVAGQEALLSEARRAATEAEVAVAEATAAVEAKTLEIELLRAAVRSFAVEAFVHPPSDDALAALDSDDPGEAAEKRALLEIQNTSDSDLLDRLSAAEEDLDAQRQLAADASARAQDKQVAAGNRLTEVTNARNAQAVYADQVEARLEHKLGEAASLNELDAQLTGEIQAEQAAATARAAELARRAREAAPRPAAAASDSSSSTGSSTGSSSGGGSGSSDGGGGSSGGGGSASQVTFNGSLSSVSCPNGGSITVASSIASSVQSLLNAAASDGIMLCGGGYRSSAGQIETRRNNCGSSDYAIYEMPPSSCSPPTARPGTCMHEKGLAVDYSSSGGTVSRGSAAGVWLRENAPSFGFQTLSCGCEPWHWSTNGN